MLNGFVNVLKPAGATASDVVVKLRRVLGEKKIGHLGTLDPGAVGVLPIAIGNGTKLFNYLTNKVKIYRAYFTFGVTTDTLDAYGTVTGIGNTVQLNDIIDCTKKFIGEIEQIPPMYSAISVGGVRAYDLARSGIEVQLKSRSVTVYDITNIVMTSQDTVVMDIECSGGTYIRSICRDMAMQLGTVAYMSGLIRLKSGNFTIDSALTYQDIERLEEKAVLNILYPLQDLPDYFVDNSMYKQLNNGVKIPCEKFGMSKIFCCHQLFGIGYSDGRLQLEYYLKNADS